MDKLQVKIKTNVFYFMSPSKLTKLEFGLHHSLPPLNLLSPLWKQKLNVEYFPSQGLAERQRLQWCVQGQLEKEG